MTHKSTQLLGLKHGRDLQSLAYLVLIPVLVAILWVTMDAGLVWGSDLSISAWIGLLCWMALYLALLFLWIGVGVVHHHHAHRAMWLSRRLNRLTDAVLAMLQGHPTFAFHATHNANHHRYHQGEQDWARTDRFWGGDHNHGLGYLAHPFQAAWVLYPHFIDFLGRLRRWYPGVWRFALLQYALVAVAWVCMLWLDAGRALVLVLVPQALAMHTLLGTNYLQHAHADGYSAWNHARNFEGRLLNLMYFNIGLHTAHHAHARAHWTQMPALHAGMRDQIHPSLLQGGVWAYVARTWVLAAWVPRWRSQSLATSGGRPASGWSLQP